MAGFQLSTEGRSRRGGTAHERRRWNHRAHGTHGSCGVEDHRRLHVSVFTCCTVQPVSLGELRTPLKYLYVFDNTADTSQFDDDDRTVSRAMADAWAQFASGNQTASGCLNGLCTVCLTIHCSTSAIA